jgi:hypothetical protein
MAGANEIRSYVGHNRIFTIPGTNPPQKTPISDVREEIMYPQDVGGFGANDLYHYRTWLEEEIQDPGHFMIGFQYWRKKDNESRWKLAGQWSFRADPFIVRFLFEEMTKRGWLEKRGVHE